MAKASSPHSALWSLTSRKVLCGGSQDLVCTLEQLEAVGRERVVVRGKGFGGRGMVRRPEQGFWRDGSMWTSAPAGWNGETDSGSGWELQLKGLSGRCGEKPRLKWRSPSRYLAWMEGAVHWPMRPQGQGCRWGKWVQCWLCGACSKYPRHVEQLLRGHEREGFLVGQGLGLAEPGRQRTDPVGG